jgi:tRNA pseudouridine55 synthase
MPSKDHCGLLVLDKPVGITSRDAVDRAARWFPRKTRLGHTGTLDPLAGGVLVLCVGGATRLTEYVQDMPKTYVADIVLGARSATDDAEGPITPVTYGRTPERRDIDAALERFMGQIEQVPPAYSAAKFGGRRSYDLARRGTSTRLTPRRVRIDRIDVERYEYPRLRLTIGCGKGTYIRALARDLGERLGCGGFVDGLRRIAVGPFTTTDAVSLEVDAEAAVARLLPPSAAVSGLPALTLNAAEIGRLRHGQPVVLGEALLQPGDAAIYDAGGVLAAIASVDASGRTIRPSKVFPA